MRAPSIGWLVVWGLFLILSRKVRPSGVLTEFARTGKRARRLAYFWWQMFQSFSAVSFVKTHGSPVAGRYGQSSLKDSQQTARNFVAKP